MALRNSFTDILRKIDKEGQGGAFERLTIGSQLCILLSDIWVSSKEDQIYAFCQCS